MGSVLASRAVPAVCLGMDMEAGTSGAMRTLEPVSYTHLRAHETVLDLVCRLLLEKKNKRNKKKNKKTNTKKKKKNTQTHNTTQEKAKSHDDAP